MVTETSIRRRVVDSSKVWTTLITNTPYLTGLLTLEYSLRATCSKYPLLVLYTDSFEAEGLAALEKRGIAKQRIGNLKPVEDKDFTNDPRFYDCWSKLYPFSLVEYDRVVQLDSDMLVVQNMDELMDIPLDINGDGVFAASHACVCNPFKKPHYPKSWVPENCGYTSQHADAASAAIRGAPATAGLAMCNGAVQVIDPSLKLFNSITTALRDPTKTNLYDFADQSLLSDIFYGRWVPLSYKYNALRTHIRTHQEIWNDAHVKNVHYILTPKPWDKPYNSNEDDGFGHTYEWWWRANNSRLEEEKVKDIQDEW